MLHVNNGSLHHHYRVNNTRTCICPPVVYPTSSASLLIAMPLSPCQQCPDNDQWDSRAEFVVLLQREREKTMEWTDWEELVQTQGGRRLPLEVGAIRCTLGCRFKLRSVAHALHGANLESLPSTNAVTPTPLKSPHELHVDQAGYRRGAQRLEFFLRPPLHPVKLSAASAFTDGFATALNIHSFRLMPVEISITGRFLLVDMLETDLYEYVSGMWNREARPPIQPTLGRRRGRPHSRIARADT